MNDYPFAKTLMQTAAALDDFGFALATVEPVADPEVDAELVRTARALASCVTGFGLRIGSYDFTLARPGPEEKLRRDSIHEAAHAVVGLALGLDVVNVTLNPGWPEGEVQFGPVGSEILDRDAGMTPERRAELRPRAEDMILTLLAGGYSESLAYSVVPVGAGHDQMVAAGVGQFFGLDASDDQLHQRAVALVQENLQAIEALSKALRSVSHVPVEVVAGLMRRPTP